MGYFPFFIDIKGKEGLIAGGGKVALHKLHKLLPYGAKLTIVSPEISDELEETAIKNDINVIKRRFDSSDIAGKFFVIAASDDSAVNAEISSLCKADNILVNVVDSKEECSFIFPSLVKEGKLSIGISTEGASPEAAASIRSQLASSIPANMEEILDYLYKLRPLAKEKITDNDRRSAFLKDMARRCMDGNTVFDEKQTLNILEEYSRNEDNDNSDNLKNGEVLIVGAGCGGYDLITLKGLRAIRRAKALVYDDLIDTRLLEYASESCEKIYVGKRSGRHSMPQEKINMLLIKKAKAHSKKGGLVVRLKGGDPFVFGRGMEEMAALRKEGIMADYIPGITSCIAVPAMAGIPVTHRNISRSFHVVTGHASQGEAALHIDFEALVKLEGTLVFLMGFSHLEQIAERLVRAGKDVLTPAAVIHGSFDETTDVVRGTLADIAVKTAAANIKTPAVIIVGKVVEIV